MRSQAEIYPPRVEMADVGSWSEDEIQRAKNLWDKEFQRSVAYRTVVKKEKKDGAKDENIR